MNRIRCLCLDVDGVLTDGRLWVDATGAALRAFHIHDGFAMRWYQRLGGIILIVTGKSSAGLAHRARELDIPDRRVIQGSEDKLADLRRLLAAEGLTLEQTAAVGDDWPDVPVLRTCGYPIAVANAVSDVRRMAKYVTSRAGGEGAVREAIEHLMRMDGSWAGVERHYWAQCGANQLKAAPERANGKMAPSRRAVKRHAGPKVRS